MCNVRAVRVTITWRTKTSGATSLSVHFLATVIFKCLFSFKLPGTVFFPHSSELTCPADVGLEIFVHADQ